MWMWRLGERMSESVWEWVVLTERWRFRTISEVRIRTTYDLEFRLGSGSTQVKVESHENSSLLSIIAYIH